MEREGVSAIVLAGGRSSRFGGDKLAAIIDGRPLLHHAIASVAVVADEVIVVAAPDDQRELPSVGVPTRLVHDARPFEGPLVGLRAGAAMATGPMLLVVAGDMPGLVPGVLRLLVDALSDGAGAAVLGDGDPATHPAPLPLALTRSVAVAAIDALLATDRRSLTALVVALHARSVDPDRWRALDPDARTLVDIDRPGDLPRG